MFAIIKISFFLTLVYFQVSQCKDEEYCKKYNGNEADFIDCCITLFPEIDNDEASEEIKYGICDKNDDKCQTLKCLMETDGLLTADGKLDKKAIINNAMLDKVDSVWLTVIQDIYKKCAQSAEGSDCVPMTFSACFEPMTFIECPASEWNNTDTCNEAKRFAEKCLLKSTTNPFLFN